MVSQPLFSREQDRGPVSSTIFKSYDIRGIAGETLTPASVYRIGRAIGSEAAARGKALLAVGRDARLSSPALSQALMAGLRDSGREVLDVGRVPTPLLYFAAHRFTGGNGVMVTASHNPADYNGLKIVIGGRALHGEGVQRLRYRIESGELVEGSGGWRQKDVAGCYLEQIVNQIRLQRPLHVVVDAGNGMAGELAPALFRRLGCMVEELYCDIDGRFPNHHPDPTEPENLQELAAVVRSRRADLGFAFDGDGDRIGLVDGNGKIIWPDRLLMLLAIDLLEKHPGAEILFDIKCSRYLAEVIEQHGGRASMWRTGHSVIRSRMQETGALLAGEFTGHLFFSDRWYGFDDALYAAARLLEILARTSDSSAAIFARLPEAVATQEFKVPVEERDHHELLRRLISRARFPGASNITLDGLRIEFPAGWALLRASNTTPSLGIRFEAESRVDLEAIQRRIRCLIHAEEPSLPLPF